MAAYVSRYETVLKEDIMTHLFSTSSAIAFAGVNPGYLGEEVAVTSSSRAAELVTSAEAEVVFREVGFSYLRPKVYFGFAVADGMFRGQAVLRRSEISAEAAKAAVDEAADGGWLVSAVNAGHVPTIAAMRSRYGIDVPVPEKAPHVTLERGDALVVMSVRGLPRLQDGRHEYTEEEVASATFSFAKWVREE